MVATDVSSRESSGSGLIDAGFETLGGEDKVNLVMKLTIGGVPGGGLGGFVGVEGVGKGEVVTSGKLEKSEATVVGFSMPESTNSAGLMLIGV